MAAIAASFMCRGAGKCGSPAPKSTRSAPVARSFSASPITADVAETSMRRMRLVRNDESWVPAAVIVWPSLEMRSRGVRLFLCDLVAYSLFHHFRQESGEWSAQLRDLPHDSRTEIGVLFGRHQEQRFYTRLHLVIHQRHLQLEFVVTDRADATQHRVRVLLDAVSHQQPLENINGDVVEPRGHFLDHLLALLHVEQRLCLVHIAGDGNDEPIEELAAAMNQVEMAVRDRIERARIDGDNILQEASEERIYAG